VTEEYQEHHSKVATTVALQALVLHDYDVCVLDTATTEAVAGHLLSRVLAGIPQFGNNYRVYI
jgi:hypothetical protein